MSTAYLIVYLWWTGTSHGSSAVTVPMADLSACRAAARAVASTAVGGALDVPRAWATCVETGARP